MNERSQNSDERRIRQLLESGSETTNDDDVALGRLDWNRRKETKSYLERAKARLKEQ